MKSEISTSVISDLETLFELKRDNEKIEEMLQTVKAYEETVRKCVILDK